MDINSVCEEAGPKRPNQVRGVFLTMLGAFCFALAPVWVRSIEAYSPISIVFYRALIGAFPLLLWVARSPDLRRSANPRRLDWKHRFVLFGVGLSMCSTAGFYPDTSPLWSEQCGDACLWQWCFCPGGSLFLAGTFGPTCLFWSFWGLFRWSCHIPFFSKHRIIFPPRRHPLLPFLSRSAAWRWVLSFMASTSACSPESGLQR